MSVIKAIWYGAIFLSYGDFAAMFASLAGTRSNGPPSIAMKNASARSRRSLGQRRLHVSGKNVHPPLQGRVWCVRQRRSRLAAHEQPFAVFPLPGPCERVEALARRPCAGGTTPVTPRSTSARPRPDGYSVTLFLGTVCWPSNREETPCLNQTRRPCVRRRLRRRHGSSAERASGPFPATSTFRRTDCQKDS